MIGLVSYFLLACAPELPVSEGLALQDQRDTLRNAALLLASDSSWTPVAGAVLDHPDAEVALSALPVAQPSYDLVDENGNPFELRVSLLPVGGEGEANDGFAVAVDPDLAPIDGAMEFWRVVEGEQEHGYLQLGDHAPALDVPTFVVTVGSVDVPQEVDDAWVQYYSKSVSTVAPSGTSSGTAYVRNSTTYSVDPDDWYGDAYYGFNTGTSTSVKSYKPTNVTLYMVQEDKCSDSCSSWAITNGCNTN